jgi:hypothetical protein
MPEELVDPAPWVDQFIRLLDLVWRHPLGWVILALMAWGMLILTIRAWRKGDK